MFRPVDFVAAGDPGEALRAAMAGPLERPPEQSGPSAVEKPGRRHHGGRGCPSFLAQAALDMALWDLKARRLGQPLWTLLGGHDPRIPCYAGGIDLDFPLDKLLRQTDDNLKKGFRAIKMKVGRPRLSEDLERVRAMREHLDADFPLMVDANMRWSVDEAVRAARGLSEFGVYWLEE